MTTFISFAALTEELLSEIVADDELHAKWLNTLSFLENCGARKIAACEHSLLVKEEMLKHAAEEFRHAHYLKRQIAKVSSRRMESYALSFMLGGIDTLHYLAALDLKASRYLKANGLPSSSIKEAAYLLVTYAIELRADELYRIYDAILRRSVSKVAVKSILLEEQGHLNEMREGLKQLPSGFLNAAHICEMESHLCEKWLKACMDDAFYCGVSGKKPPTCIFHS